MPQGKLSEIEEEKRQTELYILSLIDDGKGKRGVAKKRIPKPYKFRNVHILLPFFPKWHPSNAYFKQITNTINQNIIEIFFKIFC